MFSDCHLHSSFSGDCETPPIDMVRQAIRLGMKSICFTDHYDLDYPDDPKLFLFDIKNYFKELHLLKEKYADAIKIRIGIELGLQTHLEKECTEIATSYPFDFIIGSSHVVRHMDPYYPSYYEGRSEEECYREYFEAILDNLQTFQNFDVYGHLDYIVRYGPNKNLYYSYGIYRDILDKILRSLVEHNIGLELNTGGFAYGLGHANPHPDILKRYRELGGEILTIGSDAHKPEALAYDFDKVRDLLTDCGFRYYTVFENRKPQWIPL